MKTLLFLMVFLCLSLKPFMASAQDEKKQAVSGQIADDDMYATGDEKINNSWGFNVQISTSGFVLGGNRNIKMAPYTYLSTELNMFWVKGKNELVDYLGNTINAETILILPLTFQVKRRVLGESLTNTFRPFILAGAGGVYGWYIDGDLSRSELPADHKSSQFTWNAVAGFGADFGKPGLSSYGMDIKYQVMRFANHLGERKNFDNLQIGFHMNF
ncbi:outer membrane beta-barrel protein [bacterium]|nr:outer membrane beta-barrel protein [bacterium]